MALQEPKHLSTSARIWLAVLAVAALVARLLYVLVISPSPYGIGGDAAYYSSIANRIADGHFFTVAVAGHTYPVAEHVPLYPLFLSVVSFFGGTTILAHRIAGCVLGAAAVIPVGLLGIRVGGKRAGIIAGSIVSLYPPFVTTSGADMSEPLFVLGVAIALLLALGLRARPSVRWSIALGAAIGVSALSRGEGLLMLPLLALPATWMPASGRLARLAAVTATSALVIAPWVARNWVTFHRLMLANDTSELIAGANCKGAYYGPMLGQWSYYCANQGATPVLSGARTASASRYWEPDWKVWVDGGRSQTRGIRYAESHLGRLPIVAAARLLRIFDLYKPLDSQGYRPLRVAWFDELGFICFYAILILGALGLARLRHLRWLWLAPVSMTLLTSVLSAGIARFRVAADISFIVLAAAVLADWRGALRYRRDQGRVAAEGQVGVKDAGPRAHVALR